MNRTNNLWTPCPIDKVPLHIVEYVDLYKKALKLGFPRKSGHISKEELINYINESLHS